MTKPSETTGQSVPPIFVFFDWYNTLSTAQFWDSILGDRDHPLAGPLNAAVEDLFRGRKEFVRAWMRGHVTDEQAIASLNLNLPNGYQDDYLLRELLRDCRDAKINPAMADIVRALRDRAFLAVATDNMDCFVRATPRALTSDLRIDELIVSSSVGALKKESPERFFGPTLERYGLTPADAVLIDDCADTCQIFRAWGGSAYHHTDPGRLRADIAHLLL
ncbi:HAD family hydrolase [Microlunatus sp. GCM10028923]|uniref:HAD family hydrolase n=1 Tax=Microlunatus sp. GCM10028923 TaxID=3273400 RepID=UPI003621FC7B